MRVHLIHLANGHSHTPKIHIKTVIFITIGRIAIPWRVGRTAAHDRERVCVNEHRKRERAGTKQQENFSEQENTWTGRNAYTSVQLNNSKERQKSIWKKKKKCGLNYETVNSDWTLKSTYCFLYFRIRRSCTQTECVCEVYCDKTIWRKWEREKKSIAVLPIYRHLIFAQWHRKSHYCHANDFSNECTWHTNAKEN